MEKLNMEKMDRISIQALSVILYALIPLIAFAYLILLVSPSAGALSMLWLYALGVFCGAMGIIYPVDRIMTHFGTTISRKIGD